MTIDYRNVGKRPEGSQVNLLAHRLLRVVWPGSDLCCKIFYRLDFIFWQHVTAESREVKPAKWRVPDGPVIKVKTIDVYIGRGHVFSAVYEVTPVT